MAAQPDFVRARFTTPQRKREFVESLVRNEVLVQEAKRQGIDKRAEVQAQIEKLLIQQLVADVSRSAAPTEQDARAYFDAHPEEFTRPERVRVAVVEFGQNASTPRADRDDVEKEAMRLRALPAPERARAFASLALKRSTHESSRAVEGDIGPRTKEELSQQFSADVAVAATELKELGEVSRPAEGPRGWILIRLIGRQPAEVRAFEDEKAHLLLRLTAESRGRKLEELVSQLTATAKPEINSEVVEKLRVEAPSSLLQPVHE
jgi:parvulin-like peptidyl-prolyl isomerase